MKPPYEASLQKGPTQGRSETIAQLQLAPKERREYTGWGEARSPKPQDLYRFTRQAAKGAFEQLRKGEMIKEMLDRLCINPCISIGMGRIISA
jgi:hypothetical protein